MQPHVLKFFRAPSNRFSALISSGQLLTHQTPQTVIVDLEIQIKFYCNNRVTVSLCVCAFICYSLLILTSLISVWQK